MDDHEYRFRSSVWKHHWHEASEKYRQASTICRANGNHGVVCCVSFRYFALWVTRYDVWAGRDKRRQAEIAGRKTRIKYVTWFEWFDCSHPQTRVHCDSSATSITSKVIAIGRNSERAGPHVLTVASISARKKRGAESSVRIADDPTQLFIYAC